MCILRTICTILMAYIACCATSGNVVPSTTTTTQTTLNCIFDPCTSSAFSFCENNGTCSLDTSTCMGHCMCLDGFSGNRCENVVDGGKTDPESNGSNLCTFNPCIGMVAFCLNNGTCSLDSNTCVASCSCHTGFYGNRCEIDNTTLSTTMKSTTTQTSRICAFNPCLWSSSFCENNGTCKLDTSTCAAYCECPDDYRGSRCAEKFGSEITTKVTTTKSSQICAFDPCLWSSNFCENNGTCKLETSTCAAYCDCPDGYSGSRCSEKTQTEVTTLVTTTERPRICAFNPCLWSAGFCENNGTCKLNTSTCAAYCECPDSYSGSRCSDKTQTDVTTLETITERPSLCAFNPCVWSTNFCVNNGTCELDTSTCTSYCNCPVDYHGSRCEEKMKPEITTSITTTKSSRICAFNPCLWAVSYCENNGTCKMNTLTCLAYCKCPEGFSGSRCADKGISTAITTTLSTKTCAFDYCSWSTSFCANNATCSMDARTCMAICTCTPGYSGSRCRDKITTKSPVTVKPTEETGCGDRFNLCEVSISKICLNGGACVFNKTTCTESCICDEGYSGKYCEKKNNNEDDDSEIYEKYNVCRENALERTDSERQCDSLTFFTCVYGVCTSVLETTDYYTAYKHTCKCDPGAQGSRCEHKCCLDCGPNGNCSSVCIPGEDDCNSVCECAEGFMGERCESKIGDKNDGGSATVTESFLDPAYNVCVDGALVRTKEEQQCLSEIKCVYGICRTTPRDNGRWTGYEYTCECDIGAQGTFCEFKCCMYCGLNGHCDTYRPVAGNVSIHCDCDLNYEGEFCEIYVPPPVHIEYEENTWYLWVVGICVVTFIFLVMFAVVAPYVMWKHRVILIMKIVHYFQAYEDDDEKQWDAFVSYKADEADERFVVQVLYQKLEKEMGFKLCLHFRDFVPGETISNNIINAVEGSRRTILILTPRYIQSEFTRFEYEKAQEEMLKRKHRIIPIVLEDISETKAVMDKNLKGIIGSVTYLEWPDNDSKDKQLDKFWKRLQLSMPKKKVLESIPSEKSLESGQTSSTCVNSNSNIYSDSYNSRRKSDISDVDPQEVYNEIGPIDETISPVIRPLSETEEFVLANTSTRCSTKSDDKKYVTLLDVSSDKGNKYNLLNTQGNLKNNIMLSLDDLKLNLKNENKADEFVSIDLNDDTKDNPEFIV